MLLSGISAIGAGFMDDGTLRITLAIVGKFGATASFAAVYLYTAELYPTQIRSTAIGMCSMMARIGGFAAPQVCVLSYLKILYKNTHTSYDKIFLGCHILTTSCT